MYVTAAPCEPVLERGERRESRRAQRKVHSALSLIFLRVLSAFPLRSLRPAFLDAACRDFRWSGPVATQGRCYDRDAGVYQRVTLTPRVYVTAAPCEPILERGERRDAENAERDSISAFSGFSPRPFCFSSAFSASRFSGCCLPRFPMVAAGRDARSLLRPRRHAGAYQIRTRSSGFRYSASSGCTSKAWYHSFRLRSGPLMR